MVRIITITTALVFIYVLSGCANTKDHYVIASTGTVIGVEVSQNPVNQSPQAKLGYNRGELAIVPTNRGQCVWNNQKSQWDCSYHGLQGSGGAKDSTDVLMELRYGGIFSLGSDSGIYQRLAVGRTAVKQPGAAFMFVRKTDGSIDNHTAAQVKEAIEKIQTTPPQIRSELYVMNKAWLKLYNTDSKADVFNNAAESVGYKDFRSFLMAEPIPSTEQVNKVTELLEADSDIKNELQNARQ